MFTRILLCFDGSRCARKAADVALQMAASQNASLQILSVIPIPQHTPYVATPTKADADFERGRSYFMEGQLDLVRLARELGIRVESRIVTGNVAHAIVQCAENSGADLIVLGNGGHSTPWEHDNVNGALRGYLGSTADQVTEHAPCSVLVVR